MTKAFKFIAIIETIVITILCSINTMKTIEVDNSINSDRFQEIKNKGIITIAPALSDIPFFYIDPATNKVVGIDADIINEIAKRLGINKVNMEKTNFANLLNRLNTDNSIDYFTLT